MLSGETNRWQKTMLIQILDDFLPRAQQDEIESTLLDWRHQFEWFRYANTNHAANKTRADDVPQFIHGFMRADVDDSPFSKIPLSVVEGFGVKAGQIMRAKANLLTWEKEEIIHPKHTDDAAPHFVFIYYVNDADGDTCLYEGSEIIKRISPKKGRGVLFDGKILHASSSPVESRQRVVINFNLQPTIDASRFEGSEG